MEGFEGLPTSFGKRRGRDAADDASALSDRAQREAEIAAAIASFSEPPRHSGPRPLMRPSAAPRDSAAAAGGAAADAADAASAAAGADSADEGGDDDGDDVVGPQPAVSGAAEAEEQASGAISRARALRLPISYEVNLREHTKLVACIAMDPAGVRMATGSYDYSVRLWDFGGMDQAHRSFRSLEPQEGNAVVAVSYSPTGDRLVAATGSSKLRVYDRNALPLLTTIKGDPYILDVSNTKGHLTGVSDAHWHPREKQIILSCSLDGSVRVWDLNGKTIFEELVNQSVLRCRNARGTKVGVTCCAWSRDAAQVAAGCEDGSLQLWDSRRLRLGRPDTVVRDAHAGSAVTCVVFSPDTNTLATRGMDDAVRLWDVRRMGSAGVRGHAPLKTLGGVGTAWANSNVAFNADGSVLVAGTSVRPRSEEVAQLRFFSVPDAQEGSVYDVQLEKGISAVPVHWHPRINQLAVGMADGRVQMLYDPQLSTKGAMLSATRPVRRKAATDYIPNLGMIHTPFALPMFKEEPNLKRKRKLERQDAVASKKPQPAPQGPVQMGSSWNLAKFVMRGRTEDARAELLKYADKAAAKPDFVGRAYRQTQPQTLLAEKTLEEEAEEAEKEGK